LIRCLAGLLLPLVLMGLARPRTLLRGCLGGLRSLIFALSVLFPLTLLLFCIGLLLTVGRPIVLLSLFVAPLLLFRIGCLFGVAAFLLVLTLPRPSRTLSAAALRLLALGRRSGLTALLVLYTLFRFRLLCPPLHTVARPLIAGGGPISVLGRSRLGAGPFIALLRIRLRLCDHRAGANNKSDSRCCEPVNCHGELPCSLPKKTQFGKWRLAPP
jgi:hypothetical protein